MAGLLEYLLRNNPFSTDQPYFDPLSGAEMAAPPADPFAAIKPSKPRDTFTDAKPAIPGIGAVAGLLSGQIGRGAGQSSFADSMPDLPPATNDPTAREPEVFANGKAVERPKPMSPADALPPEAADAQAAAPLSLAPPPAMAAPQAPVPAPQGGGLGELWNRVVNPNNTATLLALASGFSGAPSIGTGMRRAFGAATPAVVADRAYAQKQEGIAQTYRALVARGVPPAEALAAVNNPDVLKATVGKYFDTTRKPMTITDATGAQQIVTVDNSGRVYDSAGRLVQEPGSPPVLGGASGSAPTATGTTQAPGTVSMSTIGSSDVLAKGVKEINQELPADEYKAQFSPQVQAAIDNYINGDTMPTSNPRLKALAGKVKEWAQLYGSKKGIVVSDAEFSRKRKLQTELGSSTPNSLGGILSNGKSAFGHLAQLAENFVDLGNRSGPDIPGGSHIGRATNVFSNTIAPTPETSGKLEAVRDNAGKYGAEATKFYAGTGGGVEERLAALHGIAQPGTLAAEQAAYLRTEKNLMVERLRQKEAQIRDDLGEKALREHPVFTKDVTDHIAKIDAAIAKLSGQSPIVAPATAPGIRKTSTGVTWSIGAPQ